MALAALKRKKQLESQLTQIDGTLTKLEYDREALEAKNNNTAVLKAMGCANKACKRVQYDM